LYAAEISFRGEKDAEPDLQASKKPGGRPLEGLWLQYTNVSFTIILRSRCTYLLEGTLSYDAAVLQSHSTNEQTGKTRNNVPTRLMVLIGDLDKRTLAYKLEKALKREQSCRCYVTAPSKVAKVVRHTDKQ